jgi:5-formyltetrahydrofolate cyclo-ligase
LLALDRRGFRLALPAVVAPSAPLAFRRWRPDDRLVRGPIGTSQPPPECPEIVPDVIIVPLLAFDRRGYRLGYGGGFYDRTLALARRRGALAAGVGYAWQEIPAVPCEPFDQPLDWVIGDAMTLRCRQ